MGILLDLIIFITFNPVNIFNIFITFNLHHLLEPGGRSGRKYTESREKFAYFKLARLGCPRNCTGSDGAWTGDRIQASQAGPGTLGYLLTENGSIGFFLESVAGVPGMVGGMLRHLRSLRKMKRDNGWIETLLEEAFNERMHLLTFLKLAEPGWFMRLMVIGAQGVFFNGFFLAYLISPRICHRFVGYLEEEAVITYSRAIEELETGKLPEWKDLDAPEIAIKYWQMPEGQRQMRDLLLFVRADEAKHREVNHTLANLKQTHDPNPYQIEYIDPSISHPTKGIDNLKPEGWDRKEIFTIEWGKVNP
ncbi:hypothetical protein PDIDSM_5777 [Penicillium digitatum]|nr:hypothetical protein PDIDSM_5777 [Penicillium digitatum]